MTMNYLTRKPYKVFFYFFLVLICLVSGTAYAQAEEFDLTGNWAGITSLVIFAIAYTLVIGEETIHLRKSKPMIVAAGSTWKRCSDMTCWNLRNSSFSCWRP
jgi:hypothetical protein